MFLSKMPINEVVLLSVSGIILLVLSVYIVTSNKKNTKISENFDMDTMAEKKNKS